MGLDGCIGLGEWIAGFVFLMGASRWVCVGRWIGWRVELSGWMGVDG